MIVLDASAAIEMFLNTDAGREIAARVLHPFETIHAPHLLDLEVAQVLRRLVHLREMEEARARESLADLRDLRIERHGHETFVDRIWQLRHNLTAYDAAYIAIAEALDCPLLTRDSRLAAAPSHGAKVEVL